MPSTELARVDNVILFCGRYLPVEVKLSVLLETNLEGQVSKYCNDSSVFLDRAEKRRVTPERFYNNHVLIIDRENLFLYDDRSGRITDLYDLDEIRRPEDVKRFRELLAQAATHHSGGSEGTVNFKRADGTVVPLTMRVFLLYTFDKHRLYLSMMG